MDDSIIKIDFSFFEEKYHETKEIPDNIIKKSEELKNNYDCFKSYYDPKMIWMKKNYVKKDKQYPVKNKFHIIIPDFNDDSKFKRKIIGLLNKLTDKNKYTIYYGIKEIINTNNDKNMIFDILWEYNKNNYKEINIDIFNFLSKETLCSHIDAKWNNYISNKEWNPPDFIYDNDILLIDDKYDIYCDYIKWKKNTSNLNKLWIKFKLEDIDILAEQILEFVLNIIDNSSAYKHIIDIFLEQLIQIISAKKNINIINKIKNIDLKNINNSTKFLIYNILDIENK